MERVWRGPDRLARFEEVVIGTGPGTLGDEIVRAVRDGGGILSAADLQAYRPVVRTPLVGQYRGYQLVTMPPPAPPKPPPAPPATA